LINFSFESGSFSARRFLYAVVIKEMLLFF